MFVIFIIFMNVMIFMWRPANSLGELVLSFHNVGLWDQTQVIPPS